MKDRRALGILFITLLLVMLSFGLIIPNLAYLAQDLDASESQVGWIMATYSLAQFLLAPAWGGYSDRFGRRPAILIGLAGNAAGLLLFGLARDLPGMFLARALSGALTAAALPTCMAYVADITDEEDRGRGMALMGAAMGLGFILGPPVGGILGRHGHHVPFLVAAAVTGLTFLFALFALREPTRDRRAAAHRPGFPSPVEALRDPLRRYFVLAFAVTFTMSGLETTFPFLVREVLGLGSGALGGMLGVMGVAVVAVQARPLGRAIRRWGEEMVLMAGLLLNAAGFFLITAARGTGGMTLWLTLAGIGNLTLRPTNASLISRRTRRGQGAAIGLMDSMDALGRVMGPFVAGHLYEANRSLPYYLGALVLSLVFVALGVNRRGGESPG